MGFWVDVGAAAAEYAPEIVDGVEAVGSAIVGGVGDAADFLGMGDTAAEAKQVVGGAVSELVPNTPAMSGVGMSASNSVGAGLGAASSGWGLSDWASEALKPVKRKYSFVGVADGKFRGNEHRA
ncbi:hypothetical protein [Citrobacter sp. U14242]|uniref:hypothetical protein n=1 Tax=Citrobacter sp. U14242 TaxID=3390192 RepID=UPI00397CD20E